MDVSTTYLTLVALEFLLAVPTFLSLLFVPAPYGRYARGGFGPTIPSRWGWVLMESPAPLLFALVFFTGPHFTGAAPIALFGLWEVHYLYRTFLFPTQIREEGRRTPVLIVLLAVGFNVLNAWINARWISTFARYGPNWLVDPRFLIGGSLFLGGLVLNVTADRALRRLRAPGETGYRIPRGGAFEWVSCPNYLGEIVEWIGWAIASWSLAGTAFAVYTAANLAPRAIAHHRWYRKEFADYPPRRRALFPFIG